MTARLPIGELFAERYRIEALLGEGGMGAVYRAKDERVGDVVALKTLVLGTGRVEEAVQRFRREVRLARRITHPNVARIHDLGEHDGIHFLTMEYVQGRDLDQLVGSEGPLPPDRAAALVLPIAKALEAIHAAGVVHRDLKPANVMVDDGGRVVLTDFGIARGDVDPAAAVKTAGPIGTPLYMAPEQIAGRPVDLRADLYALGLVLFELVTGRPPFLEATPLATALARLQKPTPDPRTMTTVPDDLAALILRCLEREPNSRPKSAGEVATTLRACACAGAEAVPVEMMATMRAAPSVSRSTMSPGDKKLAVLPFRYRGPKDHDYLGDALTDELVDLLSTTRGLSVLASGATARFRDDRDPRAVGDALDAHVVVDGSLQMVGSRVRVTTRLVEATTATQLWSDRFEGELEDVFELQDRIVRRVAESLRVGLSTESHRGAAPPEAIETYLRARRKMRTGDLSLTSPGGAIDLLEQCLEAAPDFAPALAAHAMATIRAWFVPGLGGERWETAARAAVRRALEGGEHLADSQLAAAILTTQDGRYPEAARHLERALDIAPTYGEAHDYLGRLEVEGGRVDQGLRRLRLALDLDPSLHFAWLDISRVERLRGQRATSDQAHERLEAGAGAMHPATIGNVLRSGCWDGDEARMREGVARARKGDMPVHRMLCLYGELVLGGVSPEDADFMLREVRTSMANPRFRTIAEQLAVEALGARGAVELALSHLEEAANGILMDIVWMDLCPALESLREDPRFGEHYATVSARAGAVWTG